MSSEDVTDITEYLDYTFVELAIQDADTHEQVIVNHNEDKLRQVVHDSLSQKLPTLYQLHSTRLRQLVEEHDALCAKHDQAAGTGVSSSMSLLHALNDHSRTTEELQRVASNGVQQTVALAEELRDLSDKHRSLVNAKQFVSTVITIVQHLSILRSLRDPASRGGDPHVESVDRPRTSNQPQQKSDDLSETKSSSNQPQEDPSDPTETRPPITPQTESPNPQLTPTLPEIFLFLFQTITRHSAAPHPDLKLVEAVKQELSQAVPEVSRETENAFKASARSIDRPVTPNKPLSPLDQEQLRVFSAHVERVLAVQYTIQRLLPESPAAFQSEINQGQKEIVRGVRVFSLFTAPLIKRFRFHFCSDKKTNQIDKPEWMFSFVLQCIRLNLGFLSQHVQTAVNKALDDLYLRKLYDAEAANKHALGMVPIVDSVSSFVRLFVEQVHRKLAFDFELVQEDPVLVSHLVDEMNIADQVLCSEFGYAGTGVWLDTNLAKTWPLFITFFCDDPVRFDSWIQADKHNATARLRQIIHSSTCWQTLRDVVAQTTSVCDIGPESRGDAQDTESMSTTFGSKEVLKLVENLAKRYELASNRDRYRFLSEIVLPVLDGYLDSIEAGLKMPHYEGDEALRLAFAKLNSAQHVVETLGSWLDSQPQYKLLEQMYRDHVAEERYQRDQSRRLKEKLKQSLASNVSKINHTAEEVRHELALASEQVTEAMSFSGIGSTALLRSLGVTSAVSKALDAGKNMLSSEDVLDKITHQLEPSTPAHAKVEESKIDVSDHDGAFDAEEERTDGLLGHTVNTYKTVVDRFVTDNLVPALLRSVRQDVAKYLNKMKIWSKEVEHVVSLSHDLEDAVVDLRVALRCIHKNCHPTLQRAVVKKLAQGVASLVDQMVRQNHFTQTGALQLANDMGVVFSLFKLWSNKPENVYFRREKEMLRVLTMPSQSLRSLQHTLQDLLKTWNGKDQMAPEKVQVDNILRNGNQIWSLDPVEVLSVCERRSDA